MPSTVNFNHSHQERKKDKPQRGKIMKMSGAFSQLWYGHDNSHTYQVWQKSWYFDFGNKTQRKGREIFFNIKLRAILVSIFILGHFRPGF